MTLLWVPRLGDKYGRSLFFKFGAFADFFLLLGVVFIKSWVPMMIILTMVGFLASVRTNIGYIYLLEFFSKEQAPIVGSLQMVIRAIFALITAVYFWCISKHWIYLMVGASVL